MRPRVLIPLTIGILVIVLILFLHHSKKAPQLSLPSSMAKDNNSLPASTNSIPVRKIASATSTLSLSNAVMEYVKKAWPTRNMIGNSQSIFTEGLWMRTMLR
jgi:hypothetical protein